MLNLLAAADPMEEVLPHAMLSLGGGIYVTNQMVMALVSAVIMLLIFPVLFNKARTDAPTGSRNFFEAILEFLRVEVFRPALKEHTDRFLPFLWTLFFFILFSNLIGQIPVDAIIALITHKETHIWGTPTGNIAITGGLAICAFICIHVNGLWQVAHDLMNGTYGHHAHHEEHTSDGNPPHEAAHDLAHMRGEALGADTSSDFRAMGNPTKHYGDDEFVKAPLAAHASDSIHEHGKRGMNFAKAWLLAGPLYLWNFAPHPFKPAPGQTKLLWIGDLLMWGFLLAIEIFGAFIKALALMIRLFANMVSGHLVLGSLILLIPLASGIITQLGVGTPVTLLSLMIRFLEIFVAFLQAYIFVFLTTLFLASAIAPEH